LHLGVQPAKHRLAVLVGGRAGVGQLGHERPTDQNAGDGDEKEAHVAPRQEPPLEDRLAQCEREQRQHRERRDGPDLDSLQQLSLRSSHQRGRDGDHQRQHRRGDERDVADQNPVDDPRREA
jgi:hypothetical protein